MTYESNGVNLVAGDKVYGIIGAIEFSPDHGWRVVLDNDSVGFGDKPFASLEAAECYLQAFCYELQATNQRSDTMTISSLHETTDATLIEAHKAGMAYWVRNMPDGASRVSLEMLARSCGWHEAECEAWVAGYYGARGRSIVRYTPDERIEP